LTEVNVLLVNLNARAEKHGEENVPAGDIKVRAQLGNDCLAMFHPTLKAMLYHYDKMADEDLVDKAKATDPAYLPHLRFPEIPAFSWKGEMIGARVIVHTGIDKKSDIVLDPCNVNSFSMEPQQGGTVIVSFRIQTHPDEKQFGKLYVLNGSTIKISVEPPKAEEQIV
jgi:hypothetical protein